MPDPQRQPPDLPAREESRRPLPVMPLEHEVRLDQTGAKVAAIIAVVALALGTFALFLTGQAALGMLGMVIVFVIVIGVTIAPQSNRGRGQTAVLGNEPAEPAHPDNVLQYRRPATAPTPSRNTATTASIFLCGFFLGPLAVFGVGAFAAALRLGELPGFITVTCVPVGGIVLACIPGMRALGAGILAGLGLCFLIFLSICGPILYGISQLR